MLLLLPFLITCASAVQYDYIIAGGGTGGLVVANRLSEDPDLSVLVVEAGSSVRDNENVTNVDRYSAAFNTDIDWAYETTAQDVGGRVQIFRAAKALGGTSAINGMTYIRPNKDELDAWEPYGGRNWTWESLWPYFLKSESFTIPGEQQITAGATFSTEYHGFKGPLQVSFRNPQNTTTDYVPFLNQTLARMGVPWNRDPNGGSVRGFTVHPMAIDAREYVRHDAARAYYWPVSSRSSLHVLCNTTVDRIVWAEGESYNESLIAVGVEVRDSHGSGVIHAKTELILAAGVFRSPGILELSGLGNPRTLEKYGITTRINLPAVGENLQEQINNSIAVSTHDDIGGSRSLAYVSASDIFGDQTGDIANSIAAKLPQYARKIAKANDDVVNSTRPLHLFEVQHELLFKKSVPIAEFRVNSGKKGITLGIGTYFPSLVGTCILRLRTRRCHL